MPQFQQVHCTNCDSGFTIDVIVEWCPCCGMAGYLEKQKKVTYDQ